MPQSTKKENSKSKSSKIPSKPRKGSKNVAVPHLPEHYEWVDDYCRKLKGCVRDYKEEWDATRYMLQGKFFVMIGQGPDKKSILTLKLEPGYGQLLRTNHKEVTPGYYMNKQHWNSISLEGNFSDDLLRELIDESYNILLTSFSKKVQQEIMNGQST